MGVGGLRGGGSPSSRARSKIGCLNVPHREPPPVHPDHSRPFHVWVSDVVDTDRDLLPVLHRCQHCTELSDVLHRLPVYLGDHCARCNACPFQDVPSFRHVHSADRQMIVLGVVVTGNAIDVIV